MSGRVKAERITLQTSRARITRLYAEGVLLVDIAAEYGISTHTVREIARSEGAKLRPVGRPKARR